LRDAQILYFRNLKIQSLNTALLVVKDVFFVSMKNITVSQFKPKMKIALQMSGLSVIVSTHLRSRPTVKHVTLLCTSCENYSKNKKVCHTLTLNIGSEGLLFSSCSTVAMTLTFTLTLALTLILTLKDFPKVYTNPSLNPNPNPNPNSKRFPCRSLSLPACFPKRLLPPIRLTLT
jgi:hypothetical protein